MRVPRAEACVRRFPHITRLTLPPGTVATRAFLLECFIRGLAVTAVRQPDMDARTIKDSIDEVVGRLLSP